MYSSHLNFIFSSVYYILYMLIVTSKYGITAATVLQEQFGTCNDHLNLQCLRLMIHVCTDHKQVEKLLVMGIGSIFKIDDRYINIDR